jgi:hypothetical protein
MYLLKQILPAALLALAFAAGLQGLALWRGVPRVVRMATPLALGVAYFAGHVFITGWRAFPPTDTTNWLPYFALAAAGLGVCWAMGAKFSAARLFVLALLALGAFRLLLAPKFRHGWTAGQGWLWVIFFGLGVVLLAVILGRVARRSSAAFEFPFVLLTIGAGTSAALMLSGSLLLGQLGWVFTGAIFGALIFTLRWSGTGEEITPFFALLLGALLASGYYFAELPAPSAGLLAVAPVFALIPAGRLSGLPRAALRIILVSFSVAAGVIVAFRASPPLYY